MGSTLRKEMAFGEVTNLLVGGPALLRAWASLGAGWDFAPSHRTAEWKAAARMMEAARPKLAEDAKKLKRLLKVSRKRLFPLGDPFDLDLGLHRWLNAEREEAYSDWLAWVVQQARTPARVFGLFALGRPPALVEGQH